MPDSGSRWQSLAVADLDRLREASLFRERKVIRAIDATHAELNGHRLVSFSSNDYLGLTHHRKILAAVDQAMRRDGFGSGAAPLISGYGPAHHSAEHAFAAWKDSEAAILLPSGYQANIAAIQTVAALGKLQGGVRFLIDKLSHASLLDAIKLTGEPFRVFPHNHMGKLQRLLEDAPAGQLQAVVTESIFSMDGDAADLQSIARLKEKHGFLLVLDEAHATGVYGPAGAGLAAELNLRSAVDVGVFTLSKALGAIGGAICCSNIFRDMLVNHARACLFSTGIPSAIAAAGETAIGLLRDEPERQTRVRILAKKVREQLGDTPFKIPPGDSPIIPIIVGSEEAAIRSAEILRDAGLLVLPVRPPTVPRGASRLRVTLSSQHTDSEIDQLIEAVSRLGK